MRVTVLHIIIIYAKQIVDKSRSSRPSRRVPQAVLASGKDSKHQQGRRYCHLCDGTLRRTQKNLLGTAIEVRSNNIGRGLEEVVRFARARRRRTRTVFCATTLMRRVRLLNTPDRDDGAKAAAPPAPRARTVIAVLRMCILAGFICDFGRL
jgi:hypothetical protein